MKKLLLALLVVVGLLGAAWAVDEYVRGRTEAQIAAEVGETVGAPVEVSVGGFPFLTQVAAGSLDHVELDLPEVTLDGIHLVDAHVTARGATTSQPTTIRALTATALLPIEELDRLFKAESGLTADIEVRGESLSFTGEVLGAELAVVFRPVLVEGGISLEPEELRLGGRSLDVSRLGGLIDGLGRSLVLPVGLPDGLRLSSLRIEPRGVQVELRGTDFTPDDAMFR